MFDTTEIKQILVMQMLFLFLEMKCGRNKATAMIAEMATIQQKSLEERMKSGPFTISTDGSNDNISKQYPMVVRTIDPNSGLVNSELLSVPICTESATGELNIQLSKILEFIFKK